MRAGTRFDHRLPELYGGWSQGPPLDYPAACRPQAWSAASAIVLVSAALGLSADVPAGRLTVAPSPGVRRLVPAESHGPDVAGHPLTIEVDPAGEATATTPAPVEIATTH